MHIKSVHTSHKWSSLNIHDTTTTINRIRIGSLTCDVTGLGGSLLNDKHEDSLAEKRVCGISTVIILSVLLCTRWFKSSACFSARYCKIYRFKEVFFTELDFIATCSTPLPTIWSLLLLTGSSPRSLTLSSIGKRGRGSWPKRGGQLTRV